MEVKKSPKADLEGKRTTWLLFGFILVLAAMFVAFEWTERDKQIVTETGIVEPIFEEEMIPITEQQEQQQAPPPPEAPKMEEVLQIADNDANVEESTISQVRMTTRRLWKSSMCRLKWKKKNRKNSRFSR